MKKILRYNSINDSLKNLGCGETGKNLRGTAYNEDLPNQPTTNVLTSCDCERRCLSNPDCEYWVYHAFVKHCWEKKNFERIDYSCIDCSSGFNGTFSWLNVLILIFFG